MSSENPEEVVKQWDYLCPQFCDFHARETTDQLKEIDHFFEVDHELEGQKSFYGEEVIPVSNTPVVKSKTQMSPKSSALNGVNDDFKYETPPQNKENTEDDDNDVFFSTKKYLSVERKYKLRSTPMRTLQHNGSTPLRETAISSKKKKRKTPKPNSNLKQLEENVDNSLDSPFSMQSLIQSLPIDSVITSVTAEEKPEDIITEIQINVKEEEEVINKVMIDSQEEELVENEKQNEVNEVFEYEECLPTEATDNVVVNKRESYVIERKTVTVVSPVKSSKTSYSTKKRFANSFRRKGTPIRRSVLNSGPKISTESVTSRLYSTAKKCHNQYKSMAELLREFETQPRGSQSVDLCSKSRSSSLSSLTQPKSPKFCSIYRHRPTPRQTEDIIASQIKKYSFKANPIRKKLFDPISAAVPPKVKSSKVPTKAIPMSFQTEKRHEKWANKQSSTEEKPEEDHKFKANPMPAFKNHKVMTKPDKKVTSFKPFSFDDRIQELVTKKRSQSEDNTKRDIPRNAFKF